MCSWSLHSSLISRHSSLHIRYGLIICFLAFTSFSCGNKNQGFFQEQKFSKKELIKDLKRIKSYALEEHPALLPESAKSRFKEAYENSFSLINDSLNLIDFYIIARKLVGEINCGHTRLHLPQGYWTKLTETNKHFPFKIYYADNKMFVKEDYSGIELIPPGSEILSINDKKSSEIINNLLQLITSDGLNTTFKYSQMNDIEYGLFPGYPYFPDVYNIEYKQAHKEDLEYAEIQARAKPDILKIRNKSKQQYYSSLDFTAIDSLNTAILTIKQFKYSPDTEYQEFIRISFESVHNNEITNLILDLRGNNGGDPDKAAEILSYITDTKPVYFEQWVPGYPKYKKPLQAQEPQFRGKIYVLTNGGCFSTSGHLISLIKYHKLGILIGEETGGSFYCYGCQTDITLPNTKIVFSYATCTYQTKVSGFSTTTGIHPDIKITPSIEDVISGNDAIMEFTLQLITDNL